MKYDMIVAEKLVKEIVDLVFECKIRSQKIEDLMEQLKLTEK